MKKKLSGSVDEHIDKQIQEYPDDVDFFGTVEEKLSTLVEELCPYLYSPVRSICVQCQSALATEKVGDFNCCKKCVSVKRKQLAKQKKIEALKQSVFVLPEKGCQVCGLDSKLTDLQLCNPCKGLYKQYIENDAIAKIKRPSIKLLKVKQWATTKIS